MTIKFTLTNVWIEILLNVVLFFHGFYFINYFFSIYTLSDLGNSSNLIG